MTINSDVVLWFVLGAFNLLMATLLAGARPVRLPNALGAIALAGNGIFGINYSGELFRDGREWGGWTTELTLFVNTPTLFALVLLPLVFPRSVFRPRVERILVAAAVVWTVVNWSFLFIPGIEVSNTPDDPILRWTSFIPFFLGLGGGVFVLAHAYLAGSSLVQREQARFILTALIFKVLSYVALLNESVIWEGAPWSSRPPDHRLYTAFLLAAYVGVVVAVAASRLRGARPGVPARPWSHDAFVLGLPLSVFVLTTFNGLDLEYMVIRPVLITYAILQFQFLDVEARRRRHLVTATLLVGLVTVFMYTAVYVERAGISGAGATSVALATVLGVGAIFVAPSIRLLGSVGPTPGARGQDLYRAALEEAAGTRGGAALDDPVLRALRSRLQISEREHVAMEASVEVFFGRRGADFAIGRTVFGRYQITNLLGEGGFGRTYLAHDTQMSRRVVVKASRTASPDEAARLLREARLVAQLQHPNVVTVHDVEQVGGDFFMILEYVEGGSVAERIAKGPLPEEDAVRIALDVLAGLEAAHEAGIVHRDIKPANILLTRDGRAKVADFGIARGPAGAATAKGLSMDGSQPGTVPYMAPEQVRGQPADRRTDIYAFGATLFEMLAGRSYLKFDGLSEFQARLAILKEKPMLPVRGTSPRINQALARALAKDPDARPQTAQSLAEALVLQNPDAAPGGPKRRSGRRARN